MHRNIFNYDHLYMMYKNQQDSFPPYIQLRLRRAFSWWESSNNAIYDDEKFIFLWIAFNAIYSLDRSDSIDFDDLKLSKKNNERGQLNIFLEKIVHLDKDNILKEFLINNYSNMMRVFINNKWIFNQFWEYKNGHLSDDDWKKEFNKQNRIAQRSIITNPSVFWSILFGRLYTLRNQLMHGVATKGSSINRDQVEDGSKILNKVLPILVNILMIYPNENWGKPYYRPSDRYFKD